MGRFDWERILRRLILPWDVKAVGLLMATWADADGSRIRPGIEVLTVSSGRSERTVRRLVGKLRNLGLIEVTSRGGGRGGAGRTTEYRLTIPDDLQERITVLGPDYEEPGTLGIWLATPTDPQATQTTGQSPEDSPANPGPDPSAPPVDNAEPEATHVADESPSEQPIDRPYPVTNDGLTGHLGSIDRPPGWPTTSTDQPPTTPDHYWLSPTVTRPTRDPTVDDAQHGSRLADVLPARCGHGLRSRLRDDGRPSCVFCRRDTTLLRESA